MNYLFILCQFSVFSADPRVNNCSASNVGIIGVLGALCMLKAGVSTLAVVFDLERSHDSLMRHQLWGTVAAAPAHSLLIVHLICQFGAVRMGSNRKCCFDDKE